MQAKAQAKAKPPPPIAGETPPPGQYPTPEEARMNHMKLLEGLSQAERVRRQQQTPKAPPPSLDEPKTRITICHNPYDEGRDFRRFIDAEEFRKKHQQQQERLKTPKELSNERLLKTLAEANELKRLKEAQGSGGVRSQSQSHAQSQPQVQPQGQGQQTSVIEDLMNQLSSLEDQLERRKNLESQTNMQGQRLLGYKEGFSWCPKCKFISNVGKTSDLRHRAGLRDRQRKSCERCFQWKFASPYEDEDFIYEGDKELKYA